MTAGLQQLLVCRGGARTATYVGNTSDTSDTATYTFTGASIGSASFDRVVVVAVAGRSGSNTAISSVTIGGNAATQIRQATNFSSGATICGLFALAVNSGATANIVVTFGATCARCNIGVFTLTGQTTSVAAFDSQQATSGTPAISVTLNVPSGGCGIAVECDGSSSLTNTWSGLTEDYDTAIELNNASGAHANSFAGNSALSVSATLSGARVEPVLVAASWGV